MKIHPRYYGCIVLVVLSTIVLLIIAFTSKEGFGGMVPDYCGTAGINLSDGAKNVIPSEMKTMRLYTLSECNKVEKGAFQPGKDGFGKCYQLKSDIKGTDSQRFADSNIEINYSDKCAALNSTFVSPAPAECQIDGVYAGKNNITYTNNKNIVPDGAFRFYTKNECDLLKGNFEGLEDMLAQGTVDERARAIQSNGKDYGICTSDRMFFSLACTTNAKPTGTAVVADAAKTALKGWLA